MGNLDRFEKAFDDSLVVWTTDLPPAAIGKEYAFTLQARGKPKPFRWKLVSGQLPVGMKLDDDGKVQGTPMAPEVASFVVRVACKSQPHPSAFGSSPHIGWRMRPFTLVVANSDATVKP